MSSGNREHPRTHELRDLMDFVESPSSGFVYVRGRRRVGKSWVLARLTERAPKKLLMFVGKKDLSQTRTLRAFAAMLDAFIYQTYEQLGDVEFSATKTEHFRLGDLSDDALTWERAFTFIAVFLEGASKQTPTKMATLTLIVDEIQWVAREGVGFVGSLKASWERLKQTGRFKIILCGSSNKFFEENTGGEEQILRGLKTRSDVWIHPLTLGETHRAFFPTWALQEVACIQMIFGGVPHYLQFLPEQAHFVHAVNEACFLTTSIFLEEVDELLNLDFNAQRRVNAKRIIRAIPSNGCMKSTIVEVTGMGTTTVQEIVEKLCAYGLLSTGPSQKAKKKGPPSQLLLIADPFLAFYAHVLSRFEELIVRNRTGRNIFGERVLRNSSTYYIEGFTGEAFERMTEILLTRKFRNFEPAPTDAPIFRKLRLISPDFAVSRYTSFLGGQLDLVIEDTQGRRATIVECKWGKESTSWLQELTTKTYEKLSKGQSLNKVLLCGYPVSTTLKTQLLSSGTQLLELGDLSDSI
jgi:hypothetical protein